VKKGSKGKEVKSDPIEFQTYDFGGQVVFYPTHQLFLTARSLYLVVFNVVEDDRTNVQYWLKQVKTSTKGLEAPIIVVGTHIDHPSCPSGQSLLQIGKQIQRYAARVGMTTTHALTHVTCIFAHSHI
jgi:GTPase SAR1 family protein